MTRLGDSRLAVVAAWARLPMTAAVSLLQVAAATRALSTESAATYLVLLGFAQMLGLADPGLGPALGRFTSRIASNEPERLAEAGAAYTAAIRASWAVVLAVAAIGTVGVTIFGAFPESAAGVPDHDLWAIWSIFALGSGWTLANNVKLAFLEATRGAPIANLCRLAGALSQVLLLLCILIFDWNRAEVLAATLLLGAMTTHVMAREFIPSLPSTNASDEISTSLKILLQFAKETLPLTASRIGALVLNQIPPMVLAWNGNHVETTVFVALRSLVSIATAPPSAAAAAFVPGINSTAARSDEAKLYRGYVSLLRFVLSLGAPIGFGVIICADLLLPKWLGFSPGFSVIGIAIPLVISGVLEAQHVASATFSWSKGSWPFVPTTLGAILLSLSGSILLAPYGVIGIAWSVAIAQLLTNNWYAVARGAKAAGVPIDTVLRHVIAPAGLRLSVCVGIALVARALMMDTAQVYAGIVLQAVVAAALFGPVAWQSLNTANQNLQNSPRAIPR